MSTKNSIQYKLAPQKKFYDSMGADWKPFVMFNQFPNIRSSYCNTDLFGLRFNNFENKENEYTSIFEEKVIDNKKKAVLVGNSTAFGEGATSDHKTISSYLSKFSDYHFYNFCGRGFSGYQEINNFLLLAKKIKKLERIIIVSGVIDSILPYYVKDYDDNLVPIFGYNLFLKSMRNSARGWKNKVFKNLFGNFFSKNADWNKINALNWRQELFSKEKDFIKEKINPNNNLQSIAERNLMIWSTIAKGMNIKVDFMLQPVGSWSKKKLSKEEEQIFEEENKSKDLQRFYKFVDHPKYIFFKNILKKYCEKYNINFVDCNAIFQESKYSKEWIFLNRLHLTDKGNEYTAKVLLDNFIK